MKKTYSKVIAREIKESFGRFAAIFGIVSLGVGFLSGLLVTTPDMHNTVDEYYDENNMADIFIKATMGLTEDDLKLVSSMEETNEIMPAYVTDVMMETERDEVLATRIYGLPLMNGENANINRLKLLEGRMPQKENEVLAERSGSFLANFDIGDTIKISTENEDYEDLLDRYNSMEFKVVGIVGNSFHFSMEREITNIGNGRLGAIIYADYKTYNLDVFTDFYVTARGAQEMDSFSPEYEKRIESLVEKLEKIAKERSIMRYNDVLKKAERELSFGWADYDDGKFKAEEELKDALEELEDGRRELADGLKELNDGRRELADAKITLKEETDDANREILDGKKKLEDALIELQDGEKELQDAWIELQDGQNEYQKGYIEYLDAEKELQDGQKQFDEGEEKYLDGVRKLEEGKRELRRGERELAAAREQLRDGEREIQEGWKEFLAQKEYFLSSVEPLAENFGYSSSVQMLEDPNLGAVLGGARTQIDGLIGEVQDGINEAETGLEQARVGLDQLLMIPEGTRTPEQIGKISELQGTISYLEGKLPELYGTLSELQAQKSQIPEASTLQNGWTQIKAGEKELQRGEEEIQDGWDQYYDGKEQLEEGKEELEDAEKELEDAKVEIEENRIKLQDGWKELEEGRIELQDAKKKLDDGFKEYEDGKKEIADGWKEYQDGLVEIADAEKTLQEELQKANKEIRDAEIELADGQKDYNEGLTELQDGEKKYQEGKEKAEEELNDALVELLDAEKEIKDLEVPKWYVLDRNSNVSFVSFEINAEKVAAVAKVFPIFFYLVAALVSLTTMTRMVEEERTQIGTLKALGYSKGSIVSKYIIYCGLASVLGSVFGLFVGFKLIPLLIWNAFGVMYHLPDFIAEYNTRIGLTSSVLAIISTMGATVYACNEALKEKPATLMLPRAPKAGKRIMLERVKFIWSRLSFNHKATARNLFRYKKHFFMTVIGISGCTALLLTGFGLRDSLGQIANTQFEDIYKYDIVVEVDEGWESDADLKNLLNDKKEIQGSIGIISDKSEVEVEDEKLEATLIAADLEKLKDFISIRDRKSGEPLILNKNSVIITEKLAEVLNLKNGDLFKLTNSDDEIGEFIVRGIAENYAGNNIYIHLDEYNRVFGLDDKPNYLYINTLSTDSQTLDRLTEKFLENENVLSSSILSQTKGSFGNLMESIDYIVVFIIVSSGLLAFIVLYNLTNININERKKELATLKVLGYHDYEVATYIFRETRILTIIGMFVGLVLGKFLHVFVIATVENPEYMFGRSIFALSYVFAGIITMIFSLIVNIFMKKKLKNIEMVDSMKAND